MGLSFLPLEVQEGVSHLNYNFLSEIRLRKGQPVVVEYMGKYAYLGKSGLSCDSRDKVTVSELNAVINAATGGCVYAYTEQMRNGFITVEHGVRIGVAGEYVTEKGFVSTIKSITSLNIRIPHEIKGCADSICGKLFVGVPKNTLIFSKPGLGKTTVLRDIARFLTSRSLENVLVLDERNEIAAMDGYGDGFDLGTADVVRCHDKLSSIESAVRAMKPSVIITDELYGANDVKAVQYAVDCGISVIASSHVTDRRKLSEMPFEYYVELTAIGGSPLIYDKNFDIDSFGRVDDLARGVSNGEQKKENAGVFGTLRI